MASGTFQSNIAEFVLPAETSGDAERKSSFLSGLLTAFRKFAVGIFHSRSRDALLAGCWSRSDRRSNFPALADQTAPFGLAHRVGGVDLNPLPVGAGVFSGLFQLSRGSSRSCFLDVARPRCACLPPLYRMRGHLRRPRYVDRCDAPSSAGSRAYCITRSMRSLPVSGWRTRS